MTRFALLSNATPDLLSQHLAKAGEIWTPSGFDTWIPAILDESSGLYVNNPDVVLCILDGRSWLSSCKTSEEATPILEQAAFALRTLAKRLPGALILISTLDIPHDRILPLSAARPEREWEQAWWKKVTEMSASCPHVFPFELKEVVERIGRDQFYSSKMWYLGNIPYSLKAYETIAQEILWIVNGWLGKKAKCLALDLDNTLWGGVIGEDGIEGIELSESKEGAIYRDFQRRIKELEATGIFLVLLSKNNRGDAVEAVEKHPHMILKMSDFADSEINWQEKTDSISVIAQRLNIGLDAFVFVDDNPAEQGAMRQYHPSVHVPSFPSNKAVLPDLPRDLYKKHFYCLRPTQEDLAKTGMYHAESERARVRSQFGTVPEYLRSLNICVRFSVLAESDIERVAQLTQKTNQFNLTTKRYSVGDIRQMLEHPECWTVFTVRTADRFGDNGLVCVVIVRHDHKNAEIDTFLMSCRVMGRTVEDNVLVLVEDALRTAGFVQIQASYVPTGRNDPVADFYGKNGFSIVEVSASGKKAYVYDLSCQSRCNGLVDVVKE